MSKTKKTNRRPNGIFGHLFWSFNFWPIVPTPSKGKKHRKKYKIIIKKNFLL